MTYEFEFKLLPGMHQVRNEKARRFLSNMEYKPGVSFSQVFPGLPSKGLALLRRWAYTYTG